MQGFQFQRRVGLTALAGALLLAGCSTMQTPYTPPVTKAPVQWQYGQANAGTAVTDAWWKNFSDPELDRLVALALERNNDLAAATIRVRRAQLLTKLAAENQKPQFSGSVSTSSSRRLGGDAVSGGTSSSASLGVGYEIDLWNKLGSQTDVARWEALATEQDRASTALALISTTAQLYWQTGYLNQRLAAGEQSIAVAQKTLELVQSQYRAGAVSGLEVAEAQQTLSSQQAGQTALVQQRVQATTALALLFDAPADADNPALAAMRPATLPTQPLPTVAAGLPAELLARRPDLQAAESRLREALSNTDATRASYYPSLTLTGSLGSASTALLSVLSNPVAALGVGITLPFLQRTRMDLDIQVSKNQYEEAVVNFRQTLYTAFGDVENALSARQQYAAQNALLVQSLDAARAAERMYEVRYRAGSVPLKSWLDAQEKRRSAEIALAENRLNQLTNHSTLYQALGGSAVASETAALADRR